MIILNKIASAKVWHSIVQKECMGKQGILLLLCELVRNNLMQEQNWKINFKQKKTIVVQTIYNIDWIAAD